MKMFYRWWIMELKHERPLQPLQRLLRGPNVKRSESCAASPHVTGRSTPGFDSRLDIIDSIKKRKHISTVHVSRLRDNKWTMRASEWTPKQWKRTRRRPKVRWRDDRAWYRSSKWPSIVVKISQRVKEIIGNGKHRLTDHVTRFRDKVDNKGVERNESVAKGKIAQKSDPIPRSDKGLVWLGIGSG